MTALDIQSSLYYLHVDRPDDEHIGEALRDEEERKAQADTERLEAPFGSAIIIQRKPLPPKPSLALGDRPELPPKTYPHLQLPSRGTQWDSQVAHQSVDHGMKSGYPQLQTSELRQAPRLLGPRAMYQKTSHSIRDVLMPAPERANVSLRRRSAPSAELIPNIPTRPSLRRKDVHSECTTGRPPDDMSVSKENRLPFQRYSRGNSDGQAMHNGRTDRCSPQPRISKGTCVSVTLIRRDPHSGGQWNVGKISDSSAHRNDYASSPGQMSIEIHTPGYMRFKDQIIDHGAVTNTPNAAFRFSLGNTSRKDDLAGAFHHHRTNKVNGVVRSSADSDGDGELQIPDSKPLVSPDRRSMKDAVCSFRSPWNGLCEFSTGMTGRNLKCRHQRTSISKPIVVSELRFNLPSQSLFATPPRFPMQPHAAQERKRSSIYPQQHIQRSSADDSSDDDDNDIGSGINLGQEKAGGGFGGEQAKLGKLIIEDEGQKMLDLVVAANMAMWWRVYGRSGVAFLPP